MHRILVIGTGSIGQRHLRCFQATGRAEVGFCEVSQNLRGEVAGRYSVREAFASLDEAIGRPWTAAVICTPAPVHIPMALRLAGKDIHLLVEKPLSTSTDNVRELIELVERRKLVAAVAYVNRAHPALTAMRAALVSGRFGRPMQLVVSAGQNFPTARPAYRDIYYAQRSTGGGAIQDALTHMLDAAQWLVGPIDRLTADAAHQVLEGVDVEDTVHLLARHGGVMSCFSLNQYQAPEEVVLTVVCSGGTLRAEIHQNRWRWMTEPGGAWHDEQLPPMQRDEWFTRQANAFLDAVEGKAEPLCTLREGLQTLLVNLAALESADNNAVPVKVDQH